MVYDLELLVCERHRYYREGKTKEEFCANFSLSNNQYKHFLRLAKAEGYTMPRIKSNLVISDIDFKREYAAAFQAGMTLKEMAEKLGLTYMFCYNKMKRLNLRVTIGELARRGEFIRGKK